MLQGVSCPFEILTYDLRSCWYAVQSNASMPKSLKRHWVEHLWLVSHLCQHSLCIYSTSWWRVAHGLNLAEVRQAAGSVPTVTCIDRHDKSPDSSAAALQYILRVVSLKMIWLSFSDEFFSFWTLFFNLRISKPCCLPPQIEMRKKLEMRIACWFAV